MSAPLHCAGKLRAAAIAALLCACASISAPLAAQAPEDGGQLAQTFREAFQQHEFSPKFFGPVSWMDGGKSYTALEPSASARGARDLVRYDTVTGNREVLVPASALVPPGASEPLQIEQYAWSADRERLMIYTNAQRVWRLPTRGDYWVYDLRAHTLGKLGGDAAPATLMFATFSPDGSRVAYVHDNNLYVQDLSSGAITQLTHDGSDHIVSGTSDWVYEEELDLRNAYRWSPDGKRIAYWQFDTSGVRNFALIYDVGGPYNVVTQIPYPQYGVYPYVRELPYPEPGTPNSAVRAGVVSAAGGATKWMQVPGDPGDNYIARMEWVDRDTLAMQHLNRLQNEDDVLLANASTGDVTQVYAEHDKTWVDVVQNMEWLDGGKQFLWTSERDGWRHVYLVSRDGQHVRLVTPGAFDVISVAGADPGAKWLYYMASPENATQRYLYRITLSGEGSAQRLTPADQPGTHAYNISPDFHWAIHTYSQFEVPPRTDLVSLPDHRPARMLENNSGLRQRLAALIPSRAEFFQVPVEDGIKLDAWMIKPPHFDPSKKYPLLVYVYGEPAAQTVTDSFQGERGIFHWALANEGYLVMSVDNRGTPAPKGRAWRKIVYGEVGVLSSREQAFALEEVERTRPYVDASRVAVWGWSGGGSNTLNLMFRHPELYKTGMAVAPVADQRLYDSIYQERYMGLPQQNPSGYHDGSPINFAAGLQGNLLIVHSEGDDNVHYQGTELLINRLVELSKPFDFMEYPGRTHGLSEGPNTHFHLYSLLARYLEEHVPLGSRP